MQIFIAEDPLVCTRRVEGLQQQSLRVLRDKYGNQHVAVDSVSTRKGDWVFTAGGSAARYATGDFNVHTDLTICGIIDFWQVDDK